MEQRQGSKRRASYTAEQKLEYLEVYDRICNNPAISNKADAFEKETGVSGAMVRWCVVCTGQVYTDMCGATFLCKVLYARSTRMQHGHTRNIGDTHE